MRSVTERFGLGLAAAAQCHAIANFVGLAIGADERDYLHEPTTDRYTSAPDPQLIRLNVAVF